MENVSVCKISLKYFSKALQVKPNVKLDGTERRLHELIKDYAHLFADDSGAENLPLLRGSLDHAVTLQKENDKTLSSLWGPLYGIS